MSEIIFVTDSAYHPIGEAASICVVQGRGSQYAYVQVF